MHKLNLSALVSGAVVSAIALTDAAWQAVGSRPPPWDETLHHTPVIVAVTGAHILLYVLCTAILLRYTRQIDVNRVARWARLLLATDFAVLAAGMVVYLTLWHATTPDHGAGAVLFGVSFGLMFLLSTGLGLALLRRPQFRRCALVLAAPLLLVPLVAVLGAFTSWGHPAYAETAIYLGVPLLGLAAEANHRSGSTGWSSASSSTSGDLASKAAPAAPARPRPGARSIQGHRSITRRLAVLVTAAGTIIAGLLTGAPAATAGTAAGGQTVEVVVKRDRTVVMPASIRPGVTTFQITSRRDAVFQVIRPDTGYTRPEFMRDAAAAFTKNNLKALRRLEANTTLYGGTPAAPGKPGVGSVKLSTGTYWALDFTAVAHVKPFAVTGSSVGGTLTGTRIAAVGEQAWAKSPKHIPTHGQILFTEQGHREPLPDPGAAGQGEDDQGLRHLGQARWKGQPSGEPEASRGHRRDQWRHQHEPPVPAHTGPLRPDLLLARRERGRQAPRAARDVPGHQRPLSHAGEASTECHSPRCTSPRGVTFLARYRIRIPTLTGRWGSWSVADKKAAASPTWVTRQGHVVTRHPPPADQVGADHEADHHEHPCNGFSHANDFDCRPATSCWNLGATWKAQP